MSRRNQPQGDVHRRPSHSVIGVLIAALWAGTALGQVNEYSLGGDRAWVQTEAPEPGSDAATIAEARSLLARDRPRAARRVLTRWIDAHENDNNEWLAEAYLLRGDALVAMNREFKSLFEYERVLKEYWNSEAFPIAIERELAIAKAYTRGKKIRVWGMRIGDGGEVAVEILIRVQERMPGSDAAEQAGIELADYYYRQRDMKLAHDAYDLYLQNYPHGEDRLKALQRLIQTDLARFKGPRYDASGLLDARVRIEDFLERFPTEADRTGINESLIVRVDESLGAQMLESAQWYLRSGDKPSARLALRRLLRDHPHSIAAQRAHEIALEEGWNANGSATEAPTSEPPGEADTIDLEPIEPSGAPAENEQ